MHSRLSTALLEAAVLLPSAAGNVNGSITKGRFPMSTHAIHELLSLWSKGELTAEQARPVGPGHLMQNFLALSQRQTAIEQRVRRLEGARPLDPPKPPAA
jgi:hypothetical protein